MLNNNITNSVAILVCAQATKIGGQPVQAHRLRCAPNRWLSAARTLNVYSPVCNPSYFTRLLTAITHIQTTAFLPKITSVTDYLPTLSTPLITTTTIYIN